MFLDSQQDDVVPEDVTYYLYTPQNNETFILLNSSNLDAIDSSVGVAVFIHGWNDNSSAEWYGPLKSVLQGLYDVNVIEVDYSPISYQSYPAAVLLAEQLGEFTS